LAGEPEGLPARAAALDLLRSAFDRRGGLDEALSRPAFTRLEPRERAFARALAMLTLRRLGQIDRMLETRLQKPPPDEVRAILRLGVAQLFFMDAPDFAAVSTSVDLAAASQTGRPFKGLVNGVLRTLAREGAPALDPQALAPEWLAARWRAAYGAEAAARIAEAIAEEPATDLTLRDSGRDSGLDPAGTAALAEALKAEVLPGGGLRAGLKGDLAGWPGFDEGRWWVQDSAAAVPARLLRVVPGESALDLCCAPGGKTLQLAAAGAAVVAVDRSAARQVRTADNLRRTNLAAELVTADAAAWADPRLFDAVLLDAPCSSTGVFRRHPDVLWAARPGDIAKLAAVQARLLDSAARRLKPGGRLVYCVCSLEPEEGEGQVAAALKRHPELSLDPIRPGEGGAPEAAVTPEGLLRILPFHVAGGADGFFAARFVKA
jgi:16S rRNA (cytosine967-C5)-methyltransferase